MKVTNRDKEQKILTILPFSPLLNPPGHVFPSCMHAPIFNIIFCVELLTCCYNRVLGNFTVFPNTLKLLFGQLIKT